MISIKKISAPFIGLNRRAVEYLLSVGYWCEIEDLAGGVDEYEDPNSRFGIIISDLLGEVENPIICGVLVDNKAIPAFVYDFFDYDKTTLPLFRYILNDGTNVKEVVDEDTTIYGKPCLCLKDADDNISFKWTNEDVEELIELSKD